MEKLLLIQITPEDAILNLAQRMHIRTVSVSPNDYQKSIGQLAGFPDQTATHTSDGTGLDGSMLIFCDVKRTASKSDFRKAAYHGCIHYLQGYSYSNKPPLDSIPTL